MLYCIRQQCGKPNWNGLALIHLSCLQALDEYVLLASDYFYLNADNPDFFYIVARYSKTFYSLYWNDNQVVLLGSYRIVGFKRHKNYYHWIFYAYLSVGNYQTKKWNYQVFSDHWNNTWFGKPCHVFLYAETNTLEYNKDRNCGP